MAKKTVMNKTSKSEGKGFDAHLPEDPEKAKKGPGRPKSENTKEYESSPKEGTKENETRATFIVKEDILDKLKAIAYWERSLIKDEVNKALDVHINKYKKKNGPINPIPKK